MNKKSQLQIIVEKLRETGEVSRNWCLDRFITRLGSRIYDLRKSGWDFDIEKRGGDYIYVVSAIPNPVQRSFALQETI